MLCYKDLTVGTIWTVATQRSPKRDIHLVLYLVIKNFAHSTELVWNGLVLFFWNCFKSVSTAADTVMKNERSSLTVSNYSHHFCCFVIFPSAVCLFQPFRSLIWKYWGSHSKRDIESCNQNEWDAISLSQRLSSVVLCKEYIKKKRLYWYTQDSQLQEYNDYWVLNSRLAIWKMQECAQFGFPFSFWEK